MSRHDDLESIRRLMADYCFFTDARDLDRLCALFTEDFAFSGVFGERQGHAGIRALHEANRGRPGSSRHLTVNSLIDVEGDSASARSYILVVSVQEGGISPTFAGTYADSFVRRDGRWLFKSRHIHAGPAELLATS